MTETSIDEARLEAFMGQAVTDVGAIISAPLVVIGEKLGLYKAMAGAGPLTSQQVAERAGAAERYVREWLRNQAAGGYVTYDPVTDTYTLPDEHALALADEDSPFYMLGIYDSIASLYADEDKILEARAGRQGRRRRLWSRRVHDRHGPGLSELRVPRVRLPQRLDRARPRSRGRGGRS
jgi:Rv2258c-like winged HTH domain